mmetsp:Transcript_59696/g.159750  ORF Transcript_59696/g.159750 Transcript_59696/m.159750 type:complete len:214 (-) Transcript_59696:401-1042(-)
MACAVNLPLSSARWSRSVADGACGAMKITHSPSLSVQMSRCDASVNSGISAFSQARSPPPPPPPPAPSSATLSSSSCPFTVSPIPDSENKLIQSYNGLNFSSPANLSTFFPFPSPLCITTVGNSDTPNSLVVPSATPLAITPNATVRWNTSSVLSAFHTSGAPFFSVNRSALGLVGSAARKELAAVSLPIKVTLDGMSLAILPLSAPPNSCPS